MSSGRSHLRNHHLSLNHQEDAPPEPGTALTSLTVTQPLTSPVFVQDATNGEVVGPIINTSPRIIPFHLIEANIDLYTTTASQINSRKRLSSDING
ncbi:hypothetical protein K7432_001622 [Basidiobolus ranarum]|uniref:Uncharacterized protein n=1 Tax=Basidiobolus ranarum TaxID=34480 RepID=A0ABR2W969_9FUNG